MNIKLKGITWGHSRGITPLQAVSQRYSELNPGIVIEWDKRTLQQFADYPIEQLTSSYDLLIIDHPWVGRAAATGCVLALDKYLPSDYLQDQAKNSTGASHESYFFGGHQWALAIDAATPVASYRKDLLEAAHIALPVNWNDVLELARMGKVAAPAIPIDLLMSFYSFCLANGGMLFATENEIIDTATGVAAIEQMQEFYNLLSPEMFNCNPIAVAEIMSSEDSYWYCPFAYGYSNYSRQGYAAALLHYTAPVVVNGKSLATTIGGTGISVSAQSTYKNEAIAFAQMICSGTIQSTLYVQHGGQPGHKKAWLDETANLLTNNYFKNVLPAMETGYMRPRYNGYLYFQDHAGTPLQLGLKNNASPLEILEEMNHIYQTSLQKTTINQ